MVYIFTIHYLIYIKAAVYGVVKVGGKLVAPAVEAEVEQSFGLFVSQRYEAMVACPSVVCGATVQRVLFQVAS